MPARPQIANAFGDAAAWLAVAIWLYVWVSLTPFRDLSVAPQTLTADLHSNTLNQIAAIVVFAATMTFGLRADVRPLLLRPLGLILIVFAWLALTTMLGQAGIGGARRLVLMMMMTAVASAFLLLPRDEKQLSGIFALCALVVLGLCYFGVAALPGLSIHQATDPLEPLLAGDWRGLFNHKNDAALSMALLVFVGLYVARVRSRALGWTVALLALIFVFKSGGKTAIALVPATLLFAFFIERGNLFWRALVMLFVVGGTSVLTLGATVVPALAGLGDALGIDTTFTGRSDVWAIAFDGIRAQPVFGYGYGGFWGTEDLVYGFREETSWAVTAPSAHNTYVEILLMGGVVALALVLIWVVLLPLRDLSRAVARRGPTPLLRLYTRLWVFCLVYAGMESIFLTPNGIAWFMALVAIFGLRLEARAHRRIGQPALAAAAGPEDLPGMARG